MPRSDIDYCRAGPGADEPGAAENIGMLDPVFHETPGFDEVQQSQSRTTEQGAVKTGGINQIYLTLSRL